jgi:hypothetical protein
VLLTQIPGGFWFSVIAAILIADMGLNGRTKTKKITKDNNFEVEWGIKAPYLSPVH